MELYCAVTPPGDDIPTSIPTSIIEDSIPTEEEVKWSVQRLWGKWSGGPFQMRAKNLREWLQDNQEQESGSTSEEGEEEGVMMELGGRERGANESRE